MKKACVGYAETAEASLAVIDIMAKHGVQIVGITDRGPGINNGFVWRFHVFGLADEQRQLDLVTRDIEKAPDQVDFAS